MCIRDSTNGWDHESREKAAKFFDYDHTEMNILRNFIYNVFEIGSISLDEYLDTTVFYCPRNFTKSQYIGSVSYTHLDVYKRQH